MTEALGSLPREWLLAAAFAGFAVLLIAVWLLGRRPPGQRRATGRSSGTAAEESSGNGPSAAPVRQAGGQILGSRELQEDDLGFIAGTDFDPAGHHPVVVVADGMGGHAAGEVASGLAVRAFVDAYGMEGVPAERLRTALDSANQALDDAIREDPNLWGMGTTLVAAAVTLQGLEWISVGDSPLYLHRDGRMKRLNEDHSLRPVIAALREIDPAAADRMSPHQLRSAVVGDEIARIDASSLPEVLKPLDLVIAASDGLDTLSEEETAAIIAESGAGGPEAVKDALLAAVRDRALPTQDNVTVAVLEVPAAWADLTA